MDNQAYINDPIDTFHEKNSKYRTVPIDNSSMESSSRALCSRSTLAQVIQF